MFYHFIEVFYLTLKLVTILFCKLVFLAFRDVILLLILFSIIIFMRFDPLLIFIQILSPEFLKMRQNLEFSNFTEIHICNFCIVFKTVLGFIVSNHFPCFALDHLFSSFLFFLFCSHLLHPSSFSFLLDPGLGALGGQFGEFLRASLP